MSAPAFTQGPWFWAMDGRNQPTSLMRSGSGDLVVCPQADIGDYGLSVDRWNDVSEADAALIAAPPALDEALEPFATAAAQVSPALPDDTVVTLKIGEATIYHVALGSLRNAHEALSKARAQ